MDICKLFGQNVRLYRMATGISQEALAVKLGRDQSFVSSAERGRQNITLTTLWLVASALNIKPAALLGDVLADEMNALPDKVRRKSAKRRSD